MIAILGAGISGLSMAYYLRKHGEEVVVLEKENSAGGKIKSRSEQGFTTELGPNTILLNNSSIIGILKETGLYEKLIFADPDNISKRYILYKGKPEPIPKGIFSAIRSPLISLKSIKKVLYEPWFKKKNEKKKSLAKLVKEHFGTELYANFLVPMLTGIYAGDPEKMDSEFVLPFLKKAEKDHGSIIKAMIFGKRKKDSVELPKQKIFTFKNGLQELPQAIAGQLATAVKMDAEIHSIEKTEHSYRIGYSQAEKTYELEVDQIISTLPIPILKKIKSNFLTAIHPTLEKIPYVPIAVIHLAYPKNAMGFKNKAFGLLSRPSENVPFLGVLFNSRFFPHTAPENMDLLTVICGGGFNPEIANQADEEIYGIVESSLSKLLQIKQKPTYKRINRWKNAIPQYYLGHGEILQNMNDFERKYRGFYFGGNYLNGISVSDCIKNAKIFSEKIIK